MPKQFVGKAVPITQQPNQRKGGGRKPKLVRKWIKQWNLNKKDLQDVLGNILLNYTIRELDEIRKSECDNVSVLIFSLMNDVVTSGKKGDFATHKQMMEFIVGKDDQTITIKDDTKLVDLKNLLLGQAGKSQKERERIIAGLERIIGNTE
jgi:hypothetical protein